MVEMRWERQANALDFALVDLALEVVLDQARAVQLLGTLGGLVLDGQQAQAADLLVLVLLLVVEIEPLETAQVRASPSGLREASRAKRRIKWHEGRSQEEATHGGDAVVVRWQGHLALAVNVLEVDLVALPALPVLTVDGTADKHKHEPPVKVPSRGRQLDSEGNAPLAHEHLVEDLQAAVGVVLGRDDVVVVHLLQPLRVLQQSRRGTLNVNVVGDNNDLRRSRQVRKRARSKNLSAPEPSSSRKKGAATCGLPTR